MIVLKLHSIFISTYIMTLGIFFEHNDIGLILALKDLLPYNMCNNDIYAGYEVSL